MRYLLFLLLMLGGCSFSWTEPSHVTLNDGTEFTCGGGVLFSPLNGGVVCHNRDSTAVTSMSIRDIKGVSR